MSKRQIERLKSPGLLLVIVRWRLAVGMNQTRTGSVQHVNKHHSLHKYTKQERIMISCL